MLAAIRAQPGEFRLSDLEPRRMPRRLAANGFAPSYIVKELNTLIMLNQDEALRLKQIAEEEGYQSEELIAAEKIRVYIAEEALMKRAGEQEKSLSNTGGGQYRPGVGD